MLQYVISWRDRMCDAINECTNLRDLTLIIRQLDDAYLNIIDYKKAVTKGYSKYDMYFLLNLLMRVGKTPDPSLSVPHTQAILVNHVYNLAVFTAKYFTLLKNKSLQYNQVLQALAAENPEWLDVSNYFYTGLLIEYVNRFSFKQYPIVMKIECDYQNFPRIFSVYKTNLKIDFNPDCITIKGYDNTILVPSIDYAAYSLELGDLL
jgi:hypothetical protein